MSSKVRENLKRNLRKSKASDKNLKNKMWLNTYGQYFLKRKKKMFSHNRYFHLYC